MATELLPYVPQSATYRIFHPRDFLVHESEDGIVTICSPGSDATLTLSGYCADTEITEVILSEFFEEFTETYTPTSLLKKEKVGEHLLLERQFENDDTCWRWIALAKSNQIIMASISSEDALDPREIKRFRFMLTKMEIYPGEFE